MTAAIQPSSTAIVVLGMHRSGTSATAGALRILGAALGEDMVPPAPDNPTGYWEHARVVECHERLLAALHRTWEDVRELPAGWLDSQPAAAAEAALEAVIERDFREASLWAVKDPRIGRLLPLWCRLLDRLGIRARFLFVARDPEEVAASLAARDGIAPGHARLLWLQNLLDAEAATRDRPRALIEYRRLLAEPEATLAELADDFAVTWPRPMESCRAELTAFLDSGRQHHRASPGAATGALASEVAEAYRTCTRVAHGDPAAWPAIAELRPVLALAVDRAGECAGGLAEALSKARASLAEIDRRLLDTDRALEEAKRLSLDHLEQLKRLDARLTKTDRALEEAKRLSLERLERIEALEARLIDTDRGLEEAKRLSLERLEQVQRLDARLTETDRALEDVKTLSLQRLDELGRQQARLEETEIALAQARSLADDRLKEIQQLRNDLAEHAEETARQRQRSETAEQRVAELLASRSWRYTAPLRTLSRTVRGLLVRGAGK